MDQTYLKRALEVTSSFEGGGFDDVSGDFDGEGISAGILQWNLGQDSLQPLLQAYIAKVGSTGRAQVDQVATLQNRSAVKFAKSNLLTTQGEPDMIFWKHLMSTPEMVQIQLDACKGVAATADHYQKNWGMSSLRSYCWFFDLVTQNGHLSISKPTGMTPDTYALATVANKKLWEGMTFTDEQKVLLEASHQRALLSRHEYRADVFQRKAVIAADAGYVHGDHFSLGLG